jgi:cbb3-type cytochrome oxidase maturation protein
MESLYLLIPLSLILVALALWIFFGAAESGQFDDLESPGWRILSDDDGVPDTAREDRRSRARGNPY